MKTLIKIIIVIAIGLIIGLVILAVNLSSIPKETNETKENVTYKVKSYTAVNTTDNELENEIINTVENNKIDNTNVTNIITNNVINNDTNNTEELVVDIENNNNDASDFNSKFDETKVSMTSDEVKSLILNVNSVDQELISNNSNHFVSINFVDIDDVNQSVTVENNKLVYTSTNLKLSNTVDYVVSYEKNDDGYIYIINVTKKGN